MCQKLCPVVLDARGARVPTYSFEKGRDLRKVVSAFGFAGLVPMATEARDPEEILIWKVGDAKFGCPQVLGSICYVIARPPSCI